MTGTLEALKLSTNGGVIPGGRYFSTVCEAAVVWASGVEEWWQNGLRTKIVYPNRPPIAPELRGVTQNWSAGRLVSEAVPPLVARYRQLVAAAYKACFA